MKQLAKDFGFTYKLRDKLDKFFTSEYDSNFTNFGIAKNVLEGKINNHQLYLFDVSCWLFPNVGFRNHSSKIISGNRLTVIICDKKKIILKSKISGYYPISDLREYINKITEV